MASLKSLVARFLHCKSTVLTPACVMLTSRTHGRTLPICDRHYTDLFNIKMCRRAYGTSNKFKITYENIFSSFNKQRLQDHLLKTENCKPESFNHAAVLVPLCTVDGEPSVLFTLRSTSLRRHRGQVSFPGGKMDGTDEDVIHTALRETEEELGLSTGSVDVWGTMGDLPTRDKSLVTPVLGYCGEVDLQALSLSQDEVEAVFTRTIRSLCDPRNTGQTQFRNGYTMPVYLGSEHRIWGLTSFILHQTLTNLAPGLYNFKLTFRS